MGVEATDGVVTSGKAEKVLSEGRMETVLLLPRLCRLLPPAETVLLLPRLPRLPPLLLPVLILLRLLVLLLARLVVVRLALLLALLLLDLATVGAAREGPRERDIDCELGLCEAAVDGEVALGLSGRVGAASPGGGGGASSSGSGGASSDGARVRSFSFESCTFREEGASGEGEPGGGEVGVPGLVVEGLQEGDVVLVGGGGSEGRRIFVIGSNTAFNIATISVRPSSAASDSAL